MPLGQSKDDESPTEWKWQHMKQYGTKPSPRCGCTLVVTPANRALIFGGVFDEVRKFGRLRYIYFCNQTSYTDIF